MSVNTYPCTRSNLFVKLHVFIKQKHIQSNKFVKLAHSFGFLRNIATFFRCHSSQLCSLHGIKAITEILFDKHRHTLSNRFVKHAVNQNFYQTRQTSLHTIKKFDK